MSSNSPSGGIKEMVRSFSKRERRTHWWNLTSSSSTDLLFPPANHIQSSGTISTRMNCTFKLLWYFTVARKALCLRSCRAELKIALNRCISIYYIIMEKVYCHHQGGFAFTRVCLYVTNRDVYLQEPGDAIYITIQRGRYQILWVLWVRLCIL